MTAEQLVGEATLVLRLVKKDREAEEEKIRLDGGDPGLISVEATIRLLERCRLELINSASSKVVGADEDFAGFIDYSEEIGGIDNG